MHGNLRVTMCSRKLVQLFLSLNTSASLSNVHLSFLERHAHVLLSLK